jgi:hypothetical protein
VISLKRNFKVISEFSNDAAGNGLDEAS